ncbi:MAG: M48 family metallopeptidase [Candidatus Omnitrophica bacterium]|nr:M48 family metallopeptidase [Candidatus Omnitrophota bacterium]
MNPYLVIILAILIGEYVLRVTVEMLNISSVGFSLPAEFEGYYNPEDYSRSQKYLKENTYFSLIQKTVFTTVVIIFILSGGFNLVDRISRDLSSNIEFSGLIFAGIIVFGLQIIEIPFSIYQTFVIEEKYGFNKTTVKTFITDLIKNWILLVIIAGPAFYLIVRLFVEFSDQGAWLWCWLATVLLSTFFIFIAPVLILPLFNKFTPLEDGELKKAVSDYANSQKFKIKGIFKIDGSRRSSKSNAFFTGLGKSRRIALFDTLIQKHTTEEIVSVLAHEVGHYKKKHIIKRLLLSALTKGLMFYLLSFFIKNPGLFNAFRMDEISVYAGLIFFSFLYTPISFIFSIFGNLLSRKHEYEADRYAVRTYQNPEAFISALKKLTVNNLSNLSPHRLKVFLDYSHPPVLKRVEAIRKMP